MKTELLAWLINATIATSLASISVLLLRRILQRWLGAEIAYRLWMVVPLAAIVAVFSPPQFAPAPTAVVGTSFAVAPAIQVFTQRAWIASNADLWLLGAWAIGLFALVALLIWQQQRYVARMRLRPRADGSWRSGSIDAAPALLGLLRPRLVLPEAFENDFSDDEQRLVIAHERMHQQRRDPWALAICAALRVLFWFNPLLHVAAGCFRRDMEFACDAAVLRRYPDQRRLYAAALLKTQLAGSALPIGCLWHHMPPMKERIMLLKLAKPLRRHAWIGIVLIACAAVGISGIALAGHDAAAKAADALAAPTPSVDRSYSVDLNVSIDGKHVAHPRLISRAGDDEMIKLDENGKAMGFRFHVESQSNPTQAKLVGDVMAGQDEHVISSPHLVMQLGKRSTIEVSDRSGAPVYRIDAVVSVSNGAMPPPRRGPHPRMQAEAHASATATPGERREIEIVRNGTPGPDDQSEGDDGEMGNIRDELIPGDTPEPGARIEVRREATTPTPSGGKTVRTERRIVMTRNADGTAPPPPPLPPDVGPPPMPPLPPLPPTRNAMQPPPRPMGMHAPPAPPAPPTPLAMRAPPPPPPPSPPMGMRAPAAPPAPPTPLALRTPPPSPMPPLPPIPDAMQAPPPPPPAPPGMFRGPPPPPPPPGGVGSADGLVELTVLVGIDGHAKQITVIKSKPAGMFDRQAIAAAWQWHFDPTMSDGKPVEGWVTLPMHFLTCSEKRVIQRCADKILLQRTRG
jgi:bla regulator protein BlaR1